MPEMIHALEGHARPGLFGTLGEGGPGVTLAEYRPAAMLQVGAWPQTRQQVESTLASLLGAIVPQQLGRASGTGGAVLARSSPPPPFFSIS